MSNTLILKLGNQEFEAKGVNLQQLTQTQKVFVDGKEYYLKQAQVIDGILDVELSESYCTCSQDSIKAVNLK